MRHPPDQPVRLEPAQPRTCFPPAGGFRFCFFTLGPGTATLPDDFDAAAAAGQVQRDIPGLLDVFEADNPGMHTSDTVDVDFVLSGEVDVELDDGVEVHLKAATSWSSTAPGTPGGTSPPSPASWSSPSLAPAAADTMAP